MAQFHVWPLNNNNACAKGSFCRTRSTICVSCSQRISPQSGQFVASRKQEVFQRAEKTNSKLNFPKSFVPLPNELLSRSMDEQTLIDLIYQSMEESARQVRRSLGRTSYATTREQALNQVEMLQQAKQAAQQTGK